MDQNQLTRFASLWTQAQTSVFAVISSIGTLCTSPNGLQSGPASILLDGSGQSAEDVPGESLFFEDNTDGMILLDLGTPVSISKINTFTWHQHGRIVKHRERAVQRFTLWGFEGDEMPELEAENDLRDEGWVRIAGVNSDAFFDVQKRLDRPAQQACSIRALRGTLGKYRFLLFKVQPTPTVCGVRPRARRTQLTHTLYAEIDVYGEDNASL